MKLYGVVGSPILHSRSPAMHNAAFQALGLPARYVRVAATSGAMALRAAKDIGLQGLNVTSPFKEEIAELIADRDDIVRILGAANTLVASDRGFSAFNTDPFGVIGALVDAGCDLQGEALVVGAGGAAQAAAFALVAHGMRVTIVNRTLARARRIASRLGCRAASLGSEAAREATRSARVIVAAVATDARVLRKADLPPGAFVLEARYGSQTPLACDALARGCRLVDGRRWLLHQGAQAFAHFTGRRPSLTVMSQALTGADRRTGPHLALIGFMGAGKSSVARLVGRRVGLPVVDTDLLVEQRCGTRVAQLLVDRGEEALRRQESAVVRELPRRPSLVSCGGGLVTRAAATAALLARSRLVVWLWAKPETCVGRIAHPRSRPLLGADPLREATRLLAARMGDYASACDVVVDTEGQSLRSVVDQVVCLWREARG